MMPVICNSCGGSFEGVGPGPEWGHDSLACSRVTPQRQRERIAELETALRQIAAPANWSPVLIDSANANTLNEQIHEIRMIAANALRK